MAPQQAGEPEHPGQTVPRLTRIQKSEAKAEVVSPPESEAGEPSLAVAREAVAVARDAGDSGEPSLAVAREAVARERVAVARDRAPARQQRAQEKARCRAAGVLGAAPRAVPG